MPEEASVSSLISESIAEFLSSKVTLHNEAYWFSSYDVASFLDLRNDNLINTLSGIEKDLEDVVKKYCDTTAVFLSAFAMNKSKAVSSMGKEIDVVHMTESVFYMLMQRLRTDRATVFQVHVAYALTKLRANAINMAENALPFRIAHLNGLKTVSMNEVYADLSRKLRVISGGKKSIARNKIELADKDNTKEDQYIYLNRIKKMCAAIANAITFINSTLSVYGANSFTFCDDEGTKSALSELERFDYWNRSAIKYNDDLGNRRKYHALVETGLWSEGYADRRASEQTRIAQEVSKAAGIRQRANAQLENEVKVLKEISWGIRPSDEKSMNEEDSEDITKS